MAIWLTKLPSSFVSASSSITAPCIWASLLIVWSTTFSHACLPHWYSWKLIPTKHIFSKIYEIRTYTWKYSYVWSVHASRDHSPLQARWYIPRGVLSKITSVSVDTSVLSRSKSETFILPTIPGWRTFWFPWDLEAFFFISCAWSRRNVCARLRSLDRRGEISGPLWMPPSVFFMPSDVSFSLSLFFFCSWALMVLFISRPRWKFSRCFLHVYPGQ